MSKEIKLYETKTNLDYQEYKKYNKIVFKTFRKKRIICMLLLFAIIYSLIVFQNRELNFVLILTIVIGIIIGIYLGMLLIKLLQSSMLKKTYNDLAKHSKESLNTNIYFYKNYLVQESSISKYKLEYNKIYKIVETENNFYIMIDERQGIVIIKKNCSKELIKFLEEFKESIHIYK